MSDDFFAPPAFKPDEALVQLKRALRDLRLAERGQGFELKGRAVVQLEKQTDAIQARLAKRPAQVSEWQSFAIKSGPDLRRFTDEVKKRLAAWSVDES